MTEEEHKKRHKELHQSLDELVADWIGSGRGGEEIRLPSKFTIMDLLNWAYKQREAPDHKEGKGT